MIKYTIIFSIYFSVPNRLADVCKAELSKGDFVPCSVGKSVSSTKPQHVEAEEIEEEEDTSALLSCPVDGCICTYQRYFNLERHLLLGKCKLVSEKHTFLDQAKLSHVKKVQEGTSVQPTHPSTISTVMSSDVPLAQGWDLRDTKKVTRFNENQRQYLDDKFQIGQQSGHKADPEKVSRDMRYARSDDGKRRFNVSEFLTSQQIQGYFSRAAAKLKHAVSGPPSANVDSTDDHDFEAALEEEAYSSARTSIIEQFELVHPIVYDTLNICTLYATNKLSKLTVAQLRLICSHYNMDVEAQLSRRKAPYINYISNLVGSCSCTKV